jgi:hypothetical protein
MKKFSLFLLIILIVGILKLEAQENSKKSIFMISPGYTAFNNGEQKGISFSNEYIKNINRHFTFGAIFLLAQGEGKTNDLDFQYETHISTTALVVNFFYKPFKSVKHLLLLGIGVCNDYTVTSYSNTTDYLVISDNRYTTNETDRMISFGGPVLDIRYYYNFSKNLYLGLNLNTRDLDFSQYTVGIGGGVAF